MNAESLRMLKHELRTPVNHILGYSDLLLESADDSDDRITAGLAKDIHASGQVLAKLLEKSLLSPSGQMDQTQMDSLRENIRPMVQKILQTLDSHSSLPGGDIYASDLDRIRRAVGQLMALTEKIPAAE